MLPTGSLRIQAPGRQDEGLYTCTARNRLGSTSVSSWLQISGQNSSVMSSVMSSVTSITFHPQLKSVGVQI